jgi:hypothetical protein
VVYQPGISGNPLGRPPNEAGRRKPPRKKITLAVTPDAAGKIDSLDLLDAMVSNSDLVACEELTSR